jgi:hypothetical protein
MGKTLHWRSICIHNGTWHFPEKFTDTPAQKKLSITGQQDLGEGGSLPAFWEEHCSLRKAISSLSWRSQGKNHPGELFKKSRNAKKMVSAVVLRSECPSKDHPVKGLLPRWHNWEGVKPLRGVCSRRCLCYWGCTLQGTNGAWSLPLAHSFVSWSWWGE